MNEKMRNQVAEMKKQTIGVEVEMNSITRRNAAKLAAEFFGNKGNVELVFGAVECACAVDENAAGTESVPQSREDFALYGAAVGYQALRPLADGFGFLAHHAFARAGSVDSDYIESIFKLRKA